MNLGGNVWEMVAGGSNTIGTGYTLTYSNLNDGELTAAGLFNLQLANLQLGELFLASVAVVAHRISNGIWSSGVVLLCRLRRP